MNKQEQVKPEERKEVEEQAKKLLGGEQDLSQYTIKELRDYIDGTMLFLQKTANMSEDDQKLYAECVRKTGEGSWREKFADADILFKARKQEQQGEQEEEEEEPESGEEEEVEEPERKPSPKASTPSSKKKVLNQNKAPKKNPAPLGDNEAYFKALEERSQNVRSSPTSKPYSGYFSQN